MIQVYEADFKVFETVDILLKQLGTKPVWILVRNYILRLLLEDEVLPGTHTIKHAPGVKVEVKRITRQNMNPNKHYAAHDNFVVVHTCLEGGEMIATGARERFTIATPYNPKNDTTLFEQPGGEETGPSIRTLTRGKTLVITPAAAYLSEQPLRRQDFILKAIFRVPVTALP